MGSQQALYDKLTSPLGDRFLAFITAPQTLTAGVISAPITVQLQDSFGNPVAAGTGGLDVNLSTSSSGGIFRDSADTTSMTNVTIAEGTNSASFKYRDTVTGAPTIRVLLASNLSGKRAHPPDVAKGGEEARGRVPAVAQAPL